MCYPGFLIILQIIQRSHFEALILRPCMSLSLFPLSSNLSEGHGVKCDVSAFHRMLLLLVLLSSARAD